MDELTKWELINSSEKIESLQEAILKIGAENNGLIKGRSKEWDAELQAMYVKYVVEDSYPLIEQSIIGTNLLTRSYGIRQQALYLKHYNKLYK